MRYPIINGELPPMAVVTEYHLLSPTGIVVGCFDDRDLAISRMANFGPDSKLIQVDKHLTDITPNQSRRTDVKSKEPKLRVVA